MKKGRYNGEKERNETRLQKKWMWFKHFSLILTKGVFKQTKEMFQAVY